MNRALMFGIAIFFAIVGLSLIDGSKQAVAAGGCYGGGACNGGGGCHGGNGCHGGGLFGRHRCNGGGHHACNGGGLFGCNGGGHACHGGRNACHGRDRCHGGRLFGRHRCNGGDCNGGKYGCNGGGCHGGYNGGKVEGGDMKAPPPDVVPEAPKSASTYQRVPLVFRGVIFRR